MSMIRYFVLVRKEIILAKPAEDEHDHPYWIPEETQGVAN